MTLGNSWLFPMRIRFLTPGLPAKFQKQLLYPGRRYGAANIESSRLPVPGKLYSDLILLVRRENIDNAVDGLGGIRGVQCP